ncbi:MAG: zinc-dependent metalloprotease [Flavobacteriaceae bacterium]|nr:zinc-dependent metalloprotease [Flavobacteriaceae bacterium]
MKYINILLFVSFLHTGFLISAQKSKNENKLKPIDSLTKKMTKHSGLITTYQEDDNVFLELSDSLLEKDLLMVTRFVQLPANYQAYINAGSKTSQQLIHFKKKGKQILLTQESFVNFANEEDPISQSVKLNNFPPILAAFPIKNSEENRYLIDVSSYFNNDSPGFNIIRKSLKKEYSIGSNDSKRSFIDSVKSFPENIEIRHTLTYNLGKPPRGNTANTMSFQVNHSIIALPETPMSIRYSDERVGWFSLNKYNYSSDALKSDNIRIIRRWRLEPTNLEAYNRGELVDPIKPIIYYLDPATPMKWRPYFKQGIEDWAKVFEKAGFKNAIIAKDPPTKEEDPNFSPEDIRYSTVRYVATTTRNATGPSVSDPRSGEIIESDIIWYHNHLRSYRNRYLLETGAANPKARSLDTPEEEIGEMMRRVISHEIGHALGLPHNMKASSAYPVDSLRSGNFTQKMGIATTIMDYARFNYIAQPGDENIRFVRQLGPYDDYAIDWGYRYFSDQTPESEKVLLNEMVDKKSMDPVYMFGSGGNDPDTQTENIGDDPIKASEYGLKNLKIVAKNLDKWTTTEGQSYDDLNELYNEIIGVYRRYIYHVIKMVGGVNETLMRKGQDNTPYKNLDQALQRQALDFLHVNLWDTQNWLIQKSLVSKIKDEGSLKLIQNLQMSALFRILSVNNLNRILSSHNTLVGQGLHPDEILDHFFIHLIVQTNTLDDSFKTLQIRFAERIQELSKEEELNPRIKTSLEAFKKEIYSIAKKRSKAGTKVEKIHYTYLTKLTSE